MRSKLAIVLTLLAATLLVYWQCGSHEFIILDDHSYVTLNPEIQGGLNWPGIRWAFSAASMEATGNWHPVTWLSHMADIQLFALNPAGHHLTNVCLHAANAALLFLALSAMSGALWCSAAVAAIFALHPLHVESVAWVSERKDVLSTFFWMLTMLCYASYARRPRPAPYLAALAAFCLGLMAKPMLVTLPLVLLCLDVWPLRRSAAALSAGAAPAPDPAASPAFPRRGFGALLLEKLPFLGITALFCAIALYSQGKGHMANLAEYPLAFRLYNGLLGYRGYLSKAFWPTDLAVFYPFPVLGSLRPALGCILLLLGISVPVLFNRRRRPYLLVGWLWFLVTLVPVIGIVQVGGQSMADRYMYVPLVGLSIMVVWGFAELAARLPGGRAIAAAAAVALLASLSLATWRQLGYWQNSRALLEHTLQVTSGNAFIENLLGTELFEQGRYPEALPHFQAALRINPRNELAHYRVGIISMMRGDLEGAADHLSLALYLNPASERSGNARAMLERCRTLLQKNAAQSGAKAP